MKDMRVLEIHLTHACNLACESCSHYSNQGHKGMVSLAEAEDWMKPWHQRLRPAKLHLLGGEPTLHPQLPEFMLLAHALWPESRLHLKTNGFFLHRHPELPRVLQATGAKVTLSIHHGSPEYLEKIEPARQLLRTWQAQLGIPSALSWSFKHWTRRYHGHGADLEPYEDGQPRASWEQCPARAHQLFEGKLWKCAPLAYLKLQDEKYHLSAKWQPYLNYRPLEPDCTDSQLDEFLAREEEATCNMCTAHPERFPLPAPLASLRHGADHSPAAAAEPPTGYTGPRIATLGLPLAGDPQQGWRAHPVFTVRTSQLTKLKSHAAVLSPGHTPHPPHGHREEEILLPLAGEVELQLCGQEPTPTRIRLRPGSFVYYPAHQLHTLRNPGSSNAEYLMFKWHAEQSAGESTLPTQVVRYFGADLPVGVGQNGYFKRRVLEGSTSYLHKLHCHVTTLLPGCGYPPHVDAHDVAIFTLRGKVATLGQTVGPGGVIYYPAGVEHGMQSVGKKPAVYLVFEFHGLHASREHSGCAVSSATEVNDGTRRELLQIGVRRP